MARVSMGGGKGRKKRGRVIKAKVRLESGDDFVDLKKSKEAIEAWPSIRDGW